MFGFKSAQQKRIDELVAENVAQERTIKALRAEVAQTGVMLTDACEGRDIAFRQNAHLRAEVEHLERDIAGLLPDAEKYRAQRAKAKLNLRQFKNPAPSAHEAAHH